MDAEVSIPGVGRAYQGVDGERHTRVVRVEGSGSVGVEGSARSCAFSGVGSTEGISVGTHRVAEGQDGDKDIQELSGIKEEAILGQSLLGKGILFQHGRSQRRDDQEVCKVPGEGGEEGRTSATGVWPLLEASPMPPSKKADSLLTSIFLIS